jgi:hypothetical protein
MIFQVISLIFVAIAFYFLLWRGNVENAFLAAVFGSVVFFLGIRSQIQKRRVSEVDSKKQFIDQEE